MRCLRFNLPFRGERSAKRNLQPRGAGRAEAHLTSRHQPLPSLASGGSELGTLREGINTDPVLQELAQTPLILSIMSLAFQGAGADEVIGQKRDSQEEHRKQIFRFYVEKMFQRKGTASLAFPKEKIIGWLSWLAGKMREHSQSVFLVEGLQPSWLGTRANQLAYGTVVALSLGLIFGLVFELISGQRMVLDATLGDTWSAGPESAWFYDLSTWLTQGFEQSDALIVGLIVLVGVGLGCWSESPLKNGIISGSIGGLIYGLRPGQPEVPTFVLRFGLSRGLIGGSFVGLICGLGVRSLKKITLVETLSWKWNQFWKRAIPGLIYGLIVGLMTDLIGEAIYAAVSYALTGALIFGLIGGLIDGFTDRVKADKTNPNQGMKLSWKNSLAAFLVTWLTIGLSLGVIGRVEFWQGYQLIRVLSSGLSSRLIVGVDRGGSAVIKHYALRLILWLSGYTPFKFIKFLDHCAKLILLKKVGGGYIFIHRMLLDYFADIPTQQTPVKR